MSDQIAEGTEQQPLLDEGLDRLRSILGPAWKVAPVTYSSPATPRRRYDAGFDVIVAITGPDNTGASGPILVEAKKTLTPAGARDLMPKLALMTGLTGDATALVISPWLSPQTRQTLMENDIGYLDLTGNVSFRLDRPGIVLRLQGSNRSPSPEFRPGRSLRGARAGALVRLLVDYAPPYRASQLAAATGLSLPYVSRLLDTMAQEALIERRGRSIIWVDWPRLLRVRGQASNLLNGSPLYAVSPQGGESLLRRLTELERVLSASGDTTRVRFAVTGPAAAEQVSPLTGDIEPVMIYLDGIGPGFADRGSWVTSEVINTFMEGTDLIPAGARSNVWIFTDPQPYVFAGMTTDDVPSVALSQLALDCLSGSGRVVSQGEAVIDAMKRTEGEWRRSAEFLPAEQ